MNQPHGHPNFQVTHQVEDHEPDGQGGLTKVMHVHFKTKSGTHAHVTIPATQYVVGHVAQKVKDYADQIEGVHSLGKPERAAPQQ